MTRRFEAAVTVIGYTVALGGAQSGTSSAPGSLTHMQHPVSGLDITRLEPGATHSATI